MRLDLVIVGGARTAMAEYSGTPGFGKLKDVSAIDLAAHAAKAALQRTGVNPEMVDETFVVLEEALGRLPAEQRAVFVLRVFEDLSYQEIADALEISAGTVMSRLSRAREKLRALVGPYLARDGRKASAP
jgi:DNA-directed RNA polymerase specialized sigma24 family protein